MSEDKFIMFRNRLEKVHRHLGKLAKKKGVGAFRLYDHDLPEFPYCIEIFLLNRIFIEKHLFSYWIDEHNRPTKYQVSSAVSPAMHF